ncbi:MAG: TonB-dependent receptor, partial [Gemmatimonadetes bacterium]|nr:TonB-dependent receptor [Gemmatimonadota bacterium]
MSWKSKALYFVMFWFAVTPCLADEAGLADDTTRTTKPIVVTATRSEVDAADIAANVTIIDRETIENSPAVRVDHLLRKIPGFSLLRQQSSIVSGVSIQGVSLRGVGQSATSRTLVLLDGVPLNDPYGNFIIWSRIPFESIERVEVVRGGGAGVWGNLALGGVIQIITERPKERTLRLLAEGGTRGTSNLDLFAADRNGRLSYSFGANLYDTDGYFIYREDQRGPVDEPLTARNETFNGSADFEFAPGRRIYARASYSAESKDKGTPLSRSSMINRYYGAGGELTASGGSVWSLNLFSTVRTGNNVSTSVSRSRESESPRSFEYDGGAVSYGANVQWAKKVARKHKLSVGGDLLFNDSRSNSLSGWDSDAAVYTVDGAIGGKQTMGGVFAQNIWTPTLRWNVVLGARWDQIKSHEGRIAAIDQATGDLISETVSPDDTKTAFSPSLGVVF